VSNPSQQQNEMAAEDCSPTKNQASQSCDAISLQFHNRRVSLPRLTIKEEYSVALKITTRDQDGITVILCNGRIVFGEESSQLREQVKNHLAQSKKIVLNLGGVSYIDSGGLGILVALYTSARSCGGDIKLANLTQRVGDILQITKLSTVFEVYEGEQKAIEAFA